MPLQGRLPEKLDDALTSEGKALQSSAWPVGIPEYDLYLFRQGKHFDLYRLLGAHACEQDGKPGYRFAVWAPNAQAVAVAGDFNAWSADAHLLHPVVDSGVWAGFIPDFSQGELYKFAIRQVGGQIEYKTDPFALYAELRPGTAARAWSLDTYAWGDADWMQKRAADGLPLYKPLSFYEVHAGSWRFRSQTYGDFKSYRELAQELVPYAAGLGFTHLQFMPLAEHPLDESWGYQTGHYFAPTSRFGEPDDLRHLIDTCHRAGLGVVLDWVPAHFPKDSWGLGRFDGSALFEHEDPRLGEHPDWGTYIFNYGRTEVSNFLLSNALYWLKEFHIDGLRIDAVASMLYLDYSREDGQWQPNKFGGNENLAAIEFIKELNTVVHANYPGAMMIAEESTAWAGVSRPVHEGGLGFSFKWNMGWMNDTLDYFAKEPVHRSYHQNNLTFSMLYAFHENFILPLSHDEVTHGKRHLISKMPGDQWQQFANLRLFLAYMWAHPGKKLLFMGSEFGQWREWSSREDLDWALLSFPTHRGIKHLLKDLNKLLREEPALYELDNVWGGFEWVDLSDHEASVLSFLRKGHNGEEILFVGNFTPAVRQNYRVGCRQLGVWREILNTDASFYGGGNVGNAGQVEAGLDSHLGWPHHLELTLPPLGVVGFKAQGE